MICAVFMLLSSLWGVGSIAALVIDCDGSKVLLAERYFAECPHLVRYPSREIDTRTQRDMAL